MKILICVPCMDTIPSQFAHSLATLRKVGECAVTFQIGSLIYTSRNELAKKSVEMGADYVLWLDSDMVFSTDILEKLYEDRDKGDIITGLYFRRVEPYSPVLFDKMEIDDKGCHWTDFKEIPDDIFEVGACGFGCVFMPTNIFLDVVAKFGDMFSPIASVGEDLSFCWRARQCGYNIVCDPNVQLGHVGHYVITREFYEIYKGGKNESKTD